MVTDTGRPTQENWMVYGGRAPVAGKLKKRRYWRARGRGRDWERERDWESRSERAGPEWRTWFPATAASMTHPRCSSSATVKTFCIYYWKKEYESCLCDSCSNRNSFILGVAMWKRQASRASCTFFLGSGGFQNFPVAVMCALGQLVQCKTEHLKTAHFITSVSRLICGNKTGWAVMLSDKKHFNVVSLVCWERSDSNVAMEPW